MNISHTILCLLISAIIFSPNHVFAGEYSNFLGIDFVEISAGSFKMGSCNNSIPIKYPQACKDNSINDINAYSDEFPQHTVTISTDFQISSHEITVSQFMQYVTKDSSNTLKEKEDFLIFNKRNGETAPVVYISWYDAQHFLSWLNQKKPDDDLGNYRLPTEAEWEYVARAGSPDIYFFGNSIRSLKQYAWFETNSLNINHTGPQPTGSKQANPWGIYDIYGNAWEWVADGYDPDHYKKSLLKKSEGIEKKQFPVIRGGAWNFNELYCRSAARESYPAKSRSRSIGFRIVRELVKQN